VPLRDLLRHLGLEDLWVKKESRRQAPVTIGSNAVLVSWQEGVLLNNRWGKTRLILESCQFQAIFSGLLLMGWPNKPHFRLFKASALA